MRPKDRVKRTKPSAASEPATREPAPPIQADASSAAPMPTRPPAAIVAEGSLSIAEGACVSESLWVNGQLVVGPGATLSNSATVKGGADVNDGVRITGALTVGGRLRWGRGAVAASANIEGPLMTGDHHVRATSLVAPGGIHAGSSTSPAVDR